MKKKVLIVCHSYPPNPGVGGRRWAIFTKYLCELGVEVHILTKRPLKIVNSPWLSYTQGAFLHYYKNKYPSILEKVPKSVLQKLSYKIALAITKLLSFSNYYDRGVFSQDIILNKINSILKTHKINNIIVSGAPFSFLYYGSILKIKCNNVNFIADIRDSWLKGNYFGFASLSARRKEVELQRLKQVLKCADKVLVPYPEMKLDYSNLNNLCDIELLPHAVDDEQIIPKECVKKFGLGSLSIVNFGTQYRGLQDIMKSLGLAAMKSNIIIDFYTSDYQYKKVFENNNNINFKKIVPQSEVFQILSKSQAALFFVNEDIKNYISTKYIETIACRTPIVLVGKEGDVSKFVVDNKLGVFVRDTEIHKGFDELRINLEKLDYNDSFDFSELTFNKQALRVLGLLR